MRRLGPAACAISLALAQCGAGGAPGLLFEEDFEGSVAEIEARFGNALVANVRLAPEPRPGSPGRQALVLGRGANSYFYHLLPDQDELHVRVYVRYGGNTTLDHSGVYLGGYLPRSEIPLGDAGLKGVRPTGERLVNIGLEAPSLSNPERHDFFINWVDMPGPPFGTDYWGQTMLQTENVPIVPGQWRCVELAVKQNSAPDAQDGELAFWLDGQLVAHFRPGSPRGGFDAAGNWQTSPGGTPFPGFRWRDTLAYGFNWVKLQQFHGDGGGVHDIAFDDLAVGAARIGCAAAEAP